MFYVYYNVFLGIAKMTFISQMEQIVAKWAKRQVDDEWLFQSFRKDIIGKMSTEEAYGYIDDVVGVLLQQHDEVVVNEVLETLLALARQSDTTQMPNKLESAVTQIKSMCDKYSEYTINKCSELFTHYRL